MQALRRALLVGCAATAIAAWASRPHPIPTYAVIGVAARTDGRALAHSLGLRAVEWLPELGAVEVVAPPRALARVSRSDDRRIRYVEPLQQGEFAHVRNDPLTYEDDPATGAPWEWQFHAVGADQALSDARGDPSLLVGVVDSGVSAVPDLTGKVAQTLWDPVVASSGIDTIGHGTFVSSILAARNDDGFGLAGFCGTCRLVVYRAVPLDDLQVAEGIRALTDAHVRIINLSIVLDRPSQDVIDALAYAARAGVLVVAAVGNDGSTSIDFPASNIQQPGGVASTGLAVGATDATGVRASFSNTGQQLSLVAPGTFNSGCTEGIVGAIPAIATEFEENGSCAVTMTQTGGARYAYASGTSFAVPEVAGTAALVWAAKPSLTATQVASILEQTATRPAGSGWSPATGWGTLNAKAAVESASGRRVTDAAVLSKLVVSRPRRAGGRVQVHAHARWNDGGPIVVGALPSCRIDAGGTRLRAVSSLDHGVVRCGFTIPRAAGGASVKGTVSVSAPGAKRATAGFRFAVRRQ